MAILINDDLIWVSIPKNASYSIENALINSNLKIKLSQNYDSDKRYLGNSTYKFMSHVHTPINFLINEFGTKETMCINREYSERWVSSLCQIFKQLKNLGLTLSKKWEDIDNECIYNLFDKNTIKEINTCEKKNQIALLQKLVIEDLSTNQQFIESNLLWNILVSQNYWKSNKPCTYEFNINELDKFKIFIKDRYGVDITIAKLNTTIDSTFNKNNIVLDDKLRNWIWDNFEKRFEKNNHLI